MSEEGAEQPAAEPAEKDIAPTPRASRGSKRIQQLTTDLQAAHERIKLLEADSVTVERDQLAAGVKALEAKLERMKADHATAAEQWRTSEAMLRRGLTDDEGQAVALALYARLPADERPELAAWMDSWQGDDDTDNTPARSAGRASACGVTGCTGQYPCVRQDGRSARGPRRAGGYPRVPGRASLTSAPARCSASATRLHAIESQALPAVRLKPADCFT
jgi:hypothetical protein